MRFQKSWAITKRLAPGTSGARITTCRATKGDSPRETVDVLELPEFCIGTERTPSIPRGNRRINDAEIGAQIQGKLKNQRRLNVRWCQGVSPNNRRIGGLELPKCFLPDVDPGIEFDALVPEGEENRIIGARFEVAEKARRFLQIVRRVVRTGKTFPCCFRIFQLKLPCILATNGPVQVSGASSNPYSHPPNGTFLNFGIAARARSMTRS